MAFLAWMTASALLFPINRSWGTVPAEWLMALPHDRSPRTAEFELLHGVTIDAPPATVWAWLVQLGQDRAGFYSYDRLERSFGADVHNLTELRAEWQSRQVGDRVFATQPGYLGGVLGDRPGWKVLLAEPGEALVLENWGAFVLLPDGHGGTRFLIRSTVSNADIPAWAAALNLGAFQLPHFIMQRRMMLNIKSLAEQTSRTGRIGSVGLTGSQHRRPAGRRRGEGSKMRGMAVGIPQCPMTDATIAPAPYAAIATTTPSPSVSIPDFHQRSTVTVARSAPSPNSAADVDDRRPKEAISCSHAEHVGRERDCSGDDEREQRGEPVLPRVSLLLGQVGCFTRALVSADRQKVADAHRDAVSGEVGRADDEHCELRQLRHRQRR